MMPKTMRENGFSDTGLLNLVDGTLENSEAYEPGSCNFIGMIEYIQIADARRQHLDAPFLHLFNDLVDFFGLLCRPSICSEGERPRDLLVCPK